MTASNSDQDFRRSLQQRKKNMFASCYPMLENLNYLYKTYFGPSKRYQNHLQNILTTHSSELNKGVNSKHKICIIGDIMDFKEKDLKIDQSILAYLSSADILLGNFEAIITEKTGLYKSQRISPAILEILESIPVKRKIMSVSNNHSGDFGEEEFRHTLHLLKSHGIEPTGQILDNGLPYYDVFQDFRIYTGTVWSNLKTDFITHLDDLDLEPVVERFDLLYPHWGYEFELYPRPKIVQNAQSLIQKWDAIFGTHPHVPQPITVEFDPTSQINKIIGYSLGNFITGQSRKMKQHGIIAMLEIGPNPNGIMATKSFEWKNTRCHVAEDEILITFEEEYNPDLG